jgi:4-phospho-D-threonate 3-dehydrogenase / 4-phospho-D-erythronate 3-dehydrogenase
MNKMNIGLTCGDVNGISIEVILKALMYRLKGSSYQIIVYGSAKALTFHKNLLTDEIIQLNQINTAKEAKPGVINVINCWPDTPNITLGVPTADAGDYARMMLDRACEDLRKNQIQALVTAPINKKSMELSGFPYPGHTEYLTEQFKAKESLMLLVSDDLRVGLVTNHLPIQQVAQAISKQKIVEKVRIFEKSLKMDFALERPRIAILGLNPHAGDSGAIGKEETDIIIPAIEELRKDGYYVFGPYAADGFFGSGQYTKFDGILAMYHDQGLAPFKALSFGAGVNFTAGLPIVRTSPDHGTGFDIAGKGEADEMSLIRAIFLAADIYKNRDDYEDMHMDKMDRIKKKTLDDETGEDEEMSEILPEN